MIVAGKRRPQNQHNKADPPLGQKDADLPGIGVPLTVGEFNSLSPLDGAVNLRSTSRSATGALPFFGLVDASLRPSVEGLHTAGLYPRPLYHLER